MNGVRMDYMMEKIVVVVLQFLFLSINQKYLLIQLAKQQPAVPATEQPAIVPPPQMAGAGGRGGGGRFGPGGAGGSEEATVQW